MRRRQFITARWGGNKASSGAWAAADYASGRIFSTRFIARAQHALGQRMECYSGWTRMSADPVAQLLSDPRFKGRPITWGVTPEGYDAVRRAWLTHVHAEEVLFKPFTEDEFNTQMRVMLSVFTDDCVMELATTGERWDGHVQAAELPLVFELFRSDAVDSASAGHRPSGCT